MAGMERMTGISVGPPPEKFWAENSVPDKKPKKARKPKSKAKPPKVVETPKVVESKPESEFTNRWINPTRR